MWECGYEFKYIYSETKRNEVGVILSETMKENIIEVKRVSGRCICVKIKKEKGM